jgi:hypothetical protein
MQAAGEAAAERARAAEQAALRVGQAKVALEARVAAKQAEASPNANSDRDP